MTAATLQETPYYQAHFAHAAGGDIESHKHEQILAWLQLQPGERALDVGCGLGDLAAAMSACGADVIGVDISAVAIEEARKRYPAVRFVVLDETPLPQQVGVGRFDALTCVQVLEHIPPGEVDAFIEQLAACLRDGGRLLLDVPVTDNLSDRWLMFRNQHLRGMRRPPGAIDSSFNPTHLWKIGNLEQLAERFVRRGLQPERVQKLYYVPWVLDRLGWGGAVRCLPVRWREQCLKGGTVLFRKGAAQALVQTERFSAFWSDPPGTKGLARLKKLLA